MALTPELAALLREIREVRSPVGRMKILSRAWRHLRTLSPVERRRIALQLGLGQFDPILERLGRKEDGILPNEVLQALDGMDDLDPSKVGRLVKDLRDPERRKELARRGLDLIRGRLDEGDAAGEREADAPEAAPTSGARAEQSPLPRPSPDARPALPVSAPLPSPIPGREPERPVPLRPEVPARAPATEEPHVATREDAAAPTAGPYPALATAPLEHRDARAALAAQIAAAPSLMERFGLLRRSLAAGVRPDLFAIRDLLASFPEGWARRRALIALLEHGIPGEFDDALSLIEALQRPADRRWCATILLASRTLSAAETDRIQEHLPPSSLRRRPGRRPAASRSGSRFAH